MIISDQPQGPYDRQFPRHAEGGFEARKGTSQAGSSYKGLGGSMVATADKS